MRTLYESILDTDDNIKFDLESKLKIIKALNLIRSGKTEDDLRNLRKLWKELGLDTSGYDWFYDTFVKQMSYEGIRKSNNYVLATKSDDPKYDLRINKPIPVGGPSHFIVRNAKFNKACNELLNKIFNMKKYITCYDIGKCIYVKS